MDPLITGYSYMDNKVYGGIYVFPNNLDKEEIHMPPNVTLTKVPEIPEGFQAVYQPESDRWLLQEIPKPVVVAPELPEPEFTVEDKPQFTTPFDNTPPN